MKTIFDFDFEALSIFKVLGKFGPGIIQKTLTGLFPLTWQDGIGGDLVDYSISGKTELSGVKNQLVKPSDIMNRTALGITITNNNDGSVTFSGTATATNFLHFTPYLYLTAGHKYFQCGANQNKNYSVWVDNDLTLDIGSGVIFTYHSGDAQFQLSFENGAVINDTIYPQLFDLTALVGAGNEPTTTAEAKQLIARVMNHGTPLDYYPYDSGTPYSIGVGDYGGKRNQLVRNGNFESASGWSIRSSAVGTLSVENGVATATALTNTGGDSFGMRHEMQEPIVGHKYLVSADFLIENAHSMGFDSYGGNYRINISANEWTNVSNIWKCNTVYYYIYARSQSADFVTGETYKVRNFQSFDLTEMFGQGLEPTDVSTAKQRIAEVMGGQQEYYPYDSGTDYYKIPVSVKNYDESYEQEHTIYRTSQLVAGQTIRKTTDGLPNFTNLPTGYLQMGVDTQVAPSEGSVSYQSRSVSI